MELILLQKVKNLGNLGDKVRVKPGYGRNFLVPQGKAVAATATNLAEFEKRRAEYESKANQQLSAADAFTAAGTAIEKSEVVMPEGPIRHIGEFEVQLHLHADVHTTVKVVVVADE